MNDEQALILVTGVAGFIGSFLAARLLDENREVVGIDNMNAYYDPALKRARLAQLSSRAGFRFLEGDLVDTDFMRAAFTETRPKIVVNLAAQAGVRYSLENPRSYVDSNIVGFLNILENCRAMGVEHLVYASSSSVYGANPTMPFSTRDNVDHPVSLYAASKKANELMAHSYAHLYGLPVTGLRFFTVYGPWGRPDMAYFIFTRKILAGEPIDVFNHGDLSRDFTYIDDIVDGVRKVMDHVPKGDPNWATNGASPATSTAPYQLYNIGNNRPERLLDMIETLETLLGRKAEKRFLPLQPGDVLATWADIDDLQKDTGFAPKTTLAQGLSHFVDWYRDFYKIAGKS
ncbi:NAD-dependent epimerase [Beijerinckia indica]|uniref:NAD-dependent epimerase/dehydratase n=1 Tax=Beijerinckia indica subsp. indica (strain ATCC 9039 / DSM 1715 / NCIMB 8712) TaxID=395963 RepID=B2IH32_BEII9|nr:NAD-dependent epimerase [Beijerinckia indica]ACB94446.1 NAD-dependent epimerase/dehydratase [Beijerinckia indica subsp. indica ATCC 9039]